MRAIIFANGSINGQHISTSPEDLVIAADGGARHCLNLGILPTAVIGDFDSLDNQDITILQNEGVHIIRFPSRKDKTDLELALDYAQEAGADEIIILAALGARWDQTIANILLPSVKPYAQISVIDGNHELHYLYGGNRLEIHGTIGDIVSLIPLSRRARGITTYNLEYPLESEDLLLGSTRGVSNVLLEQNAVISLTDGMLLCVVIHQNI